MLSITVDVKGRDAVFVSNIYRYYSGLCTLDLYRNPPERMPKLDQVKEKIDWLQQTFEGGTTGNRVQIAARIQARKEVTQMFKRIASYLQAVASEDDIPALIQAGFETRQSGYRRRTAPVPAT